MLQFTKEIIEDLDPKESDCKRNDTLNYIILCLCRLCKMMPRFEFLIQTTVKPLLRAAALIYFKHFHVRLLFEGGS